MKFSKILIILVLTIISFKTNGQEVIENDTISKFELLSNSIKFPEQIGFVNDFEKIFTEEEITFLEKALSYYKENNKREVAVITIDSIEDNIDFVQYATLLSDSWNVGNECNGYGLTIVFSKSLRKIRISTTSITKKYLSDDFCKKVIDENMIPEFKKGNYYDGILLGLNELIKNWI